jgi:hypothetical protein
MPVVCTLLPTVVDNDGEVLVKDEQDPCDAGWSSVVGPVPPHPDQYWTLPDGSPAADNVSDAVADETKLAHVGDNEAPENPMTGNVGTDG